MRVLAFTDVHTEEEHLKTIERKLSKVDLLINTGDFSWLGNETEEMIERFESWNKPMLLIHGNHEWEDEVKQLTKNSKHIMFKPKDIVIMEDIMFVCHGGEWYNQVSPMFEAWTIEIQKEITLKKPKKLIFLIHMPPYKTKQDYIFGAHRGNKSYRKFIEKFQPNLVLFGHFHEGFHMKDKIGKSLLVNPGPDGEFFDL